MFTAQHYRAIAKALAPTAPSYDPRFAKPKSYLAGSDAKFAEMLTAITKLFKDDNPNFDEERFHNAVFELGTAPGEVRKQS